METSIQYEVVYIKLFTIWCRDPVNIFLKRFRLCLNVKNSDKLDNEKPDFESLARTNKLNSPLES